MSKGLYLNGVWVSGNGNEFASLNPADKTTVWQGHAANADDVDTAVKAAHAALPDWAALPVAARMGVIERYKKIVEERSEELTEAIGRETGKVLWDAKTEVQGVVGKVGLSLSAYRERTGVKLIESPGVKTVLSHRPHGVMAVFGPYNFPAHLPNGHIVPALIAGNCVILKPSDYTPFVAEKMLEYWSEAGIPKGVLQLVQGARETGVALARHGGINGVLFTGSAATGIALHKQAAGRLELILALELGGNNPLIVHEAADVDAAVFVTLQSAFITTGQRCTCARRLIVPEGRAGDAFLSKLVTAAEKLTIGAYNERPQPYMGALVHEREGEKLLAAQAELVKQGAAALLTMRARDGNHAFVTPAILDVTQVPPLIPPACGGDKGGRADEERFGPFLQVIRVGGMEAAMREANNTRYGLAAGIISDNHEHIHRFLRDIRAGVVAVNRQTTGASGSLPFGGIGISGNHRPSAYYAADYCAYPMAVQESETATTPGTLPPGMVL